MSAAPQPAGSASPGTATSRPPATDASPSPFTSNPQPQTEPSQRKRQYEATIPTVADRVVQASLKAVLEPIFEADFKPCSYGFRPNRRAHDAIAEIHHFGTRGYQWALEADIKACFDEISQTALMDRLRVRIKDKRVCALVKAFLKSGIFTELGDREESLTGTPQGGILSPLLANIALSALDDHFDRQWHQQMGTSGQRCTRTRHGQGNWRFIRYADDFVLMVSGDRHHAEALREQVTAVLAPLGLRLAPEKTRTVHIALLTELTTVFGQAVEGAARVPVSLPA
jgi:RNA-directed DNA polymerase